MMTGEKAPVSWRFWLWWVLASTVGWAVGGYVGVALGGGLSMGLAVTGYVGVAAGVGTAVGMADATAAAMVASRSGVAAGSASPEPLQATAPVSDSSRNAAASSRATNFGMGGWRRIRRLI